MVYNGRSITIPNMYVCDHEVTQAEYVAVIGTNPSHFDGATGKNPDATIASGETQDNRPVDNVSWYDAIAYCARGGNNGIPESQTTYSGSNTLDDVSWHNSNSGSKTHEVKRKTANTLGIYDMFGNVWEWCWDWKNDINDNTPATGPGRVARGGHYGALDQFNEVSYRNDYQQHFRSLMFGFRVVRTLQ